MIRITLMGLIFMCFIAKTTMSSPTISTISTILNQICEMQNSHKTSIHDVPFVCVSYAQTIDGMVAIASQASQSLSSNLKLSCNDSFLLTHALRSIHDGILIGGNTLLTDNPRLNNRLWKEGSVDPKSLGKQPIPIILDTKLHHIRKLMEMNTDLNCLNYHDRIIVCCSYQSKCQYETTIQEYAKDRGAVISLIACDVNYYKSNNNTRSVLDLEIILKELHSKYGIESVMVEGGASILSAFLSQSGIKFVHSLCITICPKFIGGKSGLGALSSSSFQRQTDGGKKNGENEVRTNEGMEETNQGMMDLTEKGSCKFYSLGNDSILLASITTSME